jgi:hypothetical protein
MVSFKYEVNMHKILEDIKRKRRILKEALLGIAVVFVVFIVSTFSYYYFTVIAY